MGMTISASGIIVITLIGSMAAVAMIASFGFYFGPDIEDHMKRDYPPEQERYMRKVRQRNYHTAYLESIGRGSVSAGPGSWVG